MSCRLRAACILLVLIAGSSELAVSQGRQEGLRMGRFLFYPSVEVSASHNDNLFLRAEDQVAADIFEIGPNLVWRLPLARSKFDVAWRPRYRLYEEEVIPDTNTSVFDADFELRFRNGMVLDVSDSFEKGILEYQDVAGGEQTFAGQPFQSNSLNIGHLMPTGGRNELRAGAYANYTSFDERGGERFFDQSSGGIEVSWNYILANELRWRTDLRGGQNHLERSPFETFDLETGASVFLDDVQAEEADELSAKTGLWGQVGRWLNTSTSAGYGIMRFGMPGRGDFSGLVLDSDTRISLGRSIEFRVRFTRRPFRSAFNVANFFINENAALFVGWKSPRRLTLAVGVLRQNNEYSDAIVTDLDQDPTTGLDELGNDVLPDPEAGFVAGVIREDRLLRYEARAEFVLIDQRMSIFFNYLNEDRTSNLAFANFKSGRALLGIRFGWLAPASGGI